MRLDPLNLAPPSHPSIAPELGYSEGSVPGAVRWKPCSDAAPLFGVIGNRERERQEIAAPG